VECGSGWTGLGTIYRIKNLEREFDLVRFSTASANENSLREDSRSPDYRHVTLLCCQVGRYLVGLMAPSSRFSLSLYV
jgi:hypothetical protein